MGLLAKIFKRQVKDTSDKQRLVVDIHEAPLRERFNQEHWEDVKLAREQWFQNTPQISRIDKLVGV